MANKNETPKNTDNSALHKANVSGRFYEIFDKEKDFELAEYLDLYVKEHIYRYLLNNYELKITFKEFLSTYR